MSGNKELKIRAYHLTGNIDIKSCRDKIREKIISEGKTDLFVESGLEQYIFIFNYGVIAFYNMGEKEIGIALNRYFPSVSKAHLPTDDFVLKSGNQDEIKVEFNSLSLHLINQETIKIAMLNVAQSVALMYYDTVSQDLLMRVRQFTTQMEEEGKLKISRKNIMKFIGKALNTKNRIAENLYIFDAPPVTWNNEYLEKVNSTLSKHFDLGLRYRSIENTFSIVEDNLHAFMELYHQSESSKLEWIIIILILVEVLDTFIGKII
ncbi:RMD1 family protein [Fulvivirga sp. 29W222]|uniref:RMD1 family protein n=1 Tax=Fulvivirga marina TaxID=2494733 RepID=A0A937KBI8_9BACT|nr:RMD1 family protein [Fulvivirga marina]MBL6446971.1 RMD1 family protein [Fulvivirga marina]